MYSCVFLFFPSLACYIFYFIRVAQTTFFIPSTISWIIWTLTNLFVWIKCAEHNYDQHTIFTRNDIKFHCGLSLRKFNSIVAVLWISISLFFLHHHHHHRCCQTSFSLSTPSLFFYLTKTIAIETHSTNGFFFKNKKKSQKIILLWV